VVTTSASPLTGLVPEFNVFDLPFIVPSEKAAGSKAGIKLPFRRPQRRRFWGITGRRFFVLAFLVHL